VDQRALALTFSIIWQNTPNTHFTMAITNPELIGQYTELHQKKRYGVTANGYLSHVRACMVDLRAKKVLEYGCGRSQLGEFLKPTGVEWLRYDPAITEFSKQPEGPVDFVVCTDVMEHIPEADVDDVLRHIASFSKNVFFNIATRPARNVLPNGQNAHCTVWTAQKWEAKLREHFPVAATVHIRPEYSCLQITWDSPVGALIGEIEDLRLAASKPKKKGLAGLFGR
jgi:hypothetical protein